METFFTILILLLVVSLSGLLNRMIPFQLPLPLVQIILGAILAWNQFGLHIDFNPELFLMLFIPPLLFSDGRKTPVSEFLHSGREIISLALVLVVITVVGVGYLIHSLLPGVPLAASFALAAVLSPTDAVALSGIVGKDKLPNEIRQVVEGEALMNDASGLVSLNVAIAVAMGTMVFSFNEVSITFLRASVGGVLTGILLILCYTQVMRLIQHFGYGDSATQIIFSLLLPFSAYLVAERFEFSGILAAVSAGMAVGQSKRNRNMPYLRLRADNLWNMLEFIFNGMVFILLGLQLPGIFNSAVAQHGNGESLSVVMLFGFSLVIYIGLISVRFIWLFLMRVFSNVSKSKHPLLFARYSFCDLLITSFSGIRGAVTLAGVLSIPLFLNDGTPFPGRTQLVFIASCVILLSIVIGIMVLPFLLKNSESVSYHNDREIFFASKEAARKAIESVNALRESMLKDRMDSIEKELIKDASKKILSTLERRIITSDDVEKFGAMERLEKRFYVASLHAERDTLYALRMQKKISQATLATLLYRIDIIEILMSDAES